VRRFHCKLVKDVFFWDVSASIALGITEVWSSIARMIAEGQFLEWEEALTAGIPRPLGENPTLFATFRRLDKENQKEILFSMLKCLGATDIISEGSETIMWILASAIALDLPAVLLQAYAELRTRADGVEFIGGGILLALEGNESLSSAFCSLPPERQATLLGILKSKASEANLPEIIELIAKVESEMGLSLNGGASL